MLAEWIVQIFKYTVVCLIEVKAGGSFADLLLYNDDPSN